MGSFNLKKESLVSFNGKNWEDELKIENLNLHNPNDVRTSLFCQDIFYDRVLNPQQVVVMDEPDPNKFVRSTNIGINDLSHSIANAWSDELRGLLRVIRSAVEDNKRFLKEDKRRKLIGREAMEAIALV